MDLKSLIAKINAPTRSTLEAAAGLCMSRTHYDVELEHYLAKLIESTDGDFQPIAKRFGIDRSRLSAELTRSLDQLRSGNARTPAFSPSLIKMLTEAWNLGSIDYGSAQIRSAFTILALVMNDELRRMVREFSHELQKIEPEVLRKDLFAIVAGSREDGQTAFAVESFGAPEFRAGANASNTPHLDQYTVNLTEQAAQGKLDPVLGRDAEIRQVVDILTRRRQNNPILTGEAGVGKTAVVEGFALRVAAGDVPPALRNVAIRSLDLALLQAGAGVKGEFENRLKGLIQEVKASPSPIILFIDEAHTMIGAGGQAGQNDAANLLKPALARGELRTIAATTWSEYKKYFEKDAALARRFQVVKVEEPSEEQCSVMLRGIVSSLENHHQVRILDEAVSAAVRLSHRYLAGRQLPDKAVSVLDTACARVSLAQNSTPPAIEDASHQLDNITVQQRILEREEAVGEGHQEKLRELAAEKTALEGRLAELRQRWESENSLVSRIRNIRAKLESTPLLSANAQEDRSATAGVPVASLRAELLQLDTELRTLQGEEPLTRVCLDAETVGEVISAWTGIPVGKMVKDEIASVLQLERYLGRRIIGQPYALAAIAQRIQTSRANLDDPRKPAGVFMLVGPSGVGKTESALALSDLLYGGERNLVTINMSEFQEAHTVSTLKGSPPGYVGYGEGGVLTEAVRRRPYCVVLLDEVEKAHPDVLELFYQVFDKGVMEDGEGREIDFKNTVIILTTNACTDTIMKLTADPETTPAPDVLAKALRPELNKLFKPAFLGRMIVVPYLPIQQDALREIIHLKLSTIKCRIQQNHGIVLTFDDALVSEVAKRCTEVESGARNVDNILTNTLLPEISRQLLGRMAEGEKLPSLHVTVSPEGGFAYNWSGSEMPVLAGEVGQQAA